MGGIFHICCLSPIASVSSMFSTSAAFKAPDPTKHARSIHAVVRRFANEVRTQKKRVHRHPEGRYGRRRQVAHRVDVLHRNIQVANISSAALCSKEVLRLLTRLSSKSLLLCLRAHQRESDIYEALKFVFRRYTVYF